MTRILLFLGLACVVAISTGCGKEDRLLDHPPTLQELKDKLRDSYSSSWQFKDLQGDVTLRLAKPKIPWAQMSKLERERHMARNVMPVMLIYIQGFERDFPDQSLDSFRGAVSQNFSCLTCHGEDNTRNVDFSNFDFARPTKLFPMNPAKLPTVHDPKYGLKVKFMQYTITPAMQVLLGDDKVSCFTCHATKK